MPDHTNRTSQTDMTGETNMTDPANPADNTSAAAAALPADIESLSYEEAREQLVGVVSRLEAGGTSLEDSLALWERGEALARRCEEWLEGARKRLAAARKDS
jgi:exodeoxyribonuclease VII small subunit